MSAHSKRAKGNWRQGKGYKGDSEERQFSKREIAQQLAEDEEAYLDRYHKGARSKNMKARLEYRIRWYEEVLARNFGSSFGSMLSSGLDRAKVDLVKLLAKEKP